MLKSSRSYALAAAAFAAVLVALSPAAAPSAFAQAAPAKKPAAQKSRLEIAAEAAFKLANEKKYAEAIDAFTKLKNGEYKNFLQEQGMTSLIDYQIAACILAQKKWPEAERALADFIEKYPKDPQIMDVRLSLVTCYIQQENWEAARQMIDSILKQNPSQALRLKASISRADLLQKEGEAKDKAGTPPPEGVESNEKYALTVAAQNLFALTNNDIWIPEMIAARQKLISLYYSLGRRKEANALKAKVEGYLSGKGGALDPASQIRANMQNLEVGDDYFGQAQEIDPEIADETEDRKSVV